MKPKQVYGIALSKEDQQRVLTRFVHRSTGDNARRRNDDSSPLQFKNDVEWLANTRFHVTFSGRLDLRYGHCESNPTWPNNPELRKTAVQP